MSAAVAVAEPEAEPFDGRLEAIEDARARYVATGNPIYACEALALHRPEEPLQPWLAAAMRRQAMWWVDAARSQRSPAEIGAAARDMIADWRQDRADERAHALIFLTHRARGGKLADAIEGGARKRGVSAPTLWRLWARVRKLRGY